MNNKFFDEFISEETITRLTDEMLRKKNEYNLNKKSKYKSAKILPIAMAISIVLFIGFVNLISYNAGNNREPNKNSNIFLTETFPTESVIESTADKLTSEIATSSVYIPFTAFSSFAYIAPSITIEFSNSNSNEREINYDSFT